MRIMVAEKPSIAKSVVEILSNNSYQREGGWKYCQNFKFELNGQPTIMTSVAGHVMEIEFQGNYSKWDSCLPIQLMTAKVHQSINKEMAGLANNLKQLARQCTELIILTDNDREGEYIGWEIKHVMMQNNASFPVKRMRFSVVQFNNIWRAYNNLGTIDDLQVAAVYCRSELDLRIGASFTRHLTINLKRFTADKAILSYGSCQFPTLGFVVARYKERESFISEPFYGISVNITKSNILHPFRWKRGHLFDKHSVEAIHHSLVNHPAVVKDVSVIKTTKLAPLPLTTVSLCKAGSRLLHMNSATIMKIAEDLYHKGLISYPRTETDQFEPDFKLKELIQGQHQNSAYQSFCDKLLSNNNSLYRFPRKGKHNDKAHPPIHPTGNGSHLTGNNKRVFDYISRRFLGCCAKDAIGHQTTISIEINKEQFSVDGLVVLEYNYLDIYIFDKWVNNKVAEFNKDDIINTFTASLFTGKTTAVPLLTEADLIGLMDKHGIGTDATMHDHIAKIFTRNYVQYNGENKSSKFIIPTSLGIALVEGLDAIPFTNMAPLSEPQLRAEMEYNLTEICKGNKNRDEVLTIMIQKYKHVFQKMMAFDQTMQSIFQAKVTEIINENNGNDNDSPDQRPARQLQRAPTHNNSQQINQPIRCDCGLIASEKTANTEANRNRKFYSCAKTSATAKCKFFKWENEVASNSVNENVIYNNNNNNNNVNDGGFKCYICQDAGHMANACPNKQKKKVFKRAYKRKGRNNK